MAERKKRVYVTETREAQYYYCKRCGIRLLQKREPSEGKCIDCRGMTMPVRR